MPTIDIRLNEPNSLPDVAEDFNRLLKMIDVLQSRVEALESRVEALETPAG